MGFYTVLYRANRLLERQGWRLHHCRRCDCGDLRYYVTDGNGAVLTPIDEGRKGMTLAQLLQWLTRQRSAELVAFATAHQGNPDLAA